MTRNEWLEARKSGIGASDASCIVGVNPWKSNERLWEEKTGRLQAENLDGKDAVEYGKRAEAFLRELFALDFPQYAVSYDEFGMIANIPDAPWLFATLDGDLTEIKTGRKGVLEIKTTEIHTARDWDKWNGCVPQYYYTQILHQLLATGYDFAVLKAQIKDRRGDNPDDVKIYVRHYTLERSDAMADMQLLYQKEKVFRACVEENRRPPLILPEI